MSVPFVSIFFEMLSDSFFLRVTEVVLKALMAGVVDLPLCCVDITVRR